MRNEELMRQQIICISINSAIAIIIDSPVAFRYKTILKCACTQISRRSCPPSSGQLSGWGRLQARTTGVLTYLTLARAARLNLYIQCSVPFHCKQFTGIMCVLKIMASYDCTKHQTGVLPFGAWMRTSFIASLQGHPKRVLSTLNQIASQLRWCTRVFHIQDILKIT